MTAKTVNKLAVPGATLHYEVTGSGPVLLLIAGGFTDGGVFDSIVGQLAAEYTVVTYDPRGNSRSPYEGAPVDEKVSTAAADALALIDHVAGKEPAYVFGSSSGAITGLELITRFPDRVRMLVAHEPPAVELLPDAETARAFFEDVRETYAEDGVGAALALFAGGLGLDDEEPAPEDLRPEYREVVDRMQANAALFFEHKLLPYTRYVPDLGALQTVAHKVVPAAGAESANHLPGRPIEVIADTIGWPVVTFPGGHLGYASHPVPFATLLGKLLYAEVNVPEVG
ncbi:pimeloyl-ACP methyl ester carboxylesterase [Kribbella amoyensis]|uniref:Pimeloyl-ACP methyl ester carboxylesterase n=1 Tax=Kribbella amoyensis TaxID=996641 RepID=A0A561B7E3_9ACTN|nr:alpha/beta hydrolase [Kribbella amoyensis]TWD74753.1 pimeloyl-ACP methyl ester carboxylesterase [Kribbella amoyensis]